MNHAATFKCIVHFPIFKPFKKCIRWETWRSYGTVSIQKALGKFLFYYFIYFGNLCVNSDKLFQAFFATFLSRNIKNSFKGCFHGGLLNQYLQPEHSNESLSTLAFKAKPLLKSAVQDNSVDKGYKTSSSKLECTV